MKSEDINAQRWAEEEDLKGREGIRGDLGGTKRVWGQAWVRTGVGMRVGRMPGSRVPGALTGKGRTAWFPMNRGALDS